MAGRLIRSAAICRRVPGFSGLAGLAALSLLAACGTLDKKLVENGIPKSGTVIPAVPIRLTPQYTTTLGALVDKTVAAVVLDYVYRPLDPNWDVADIPLSSDTHRLSLRMKRFITGGEGEAWQTAKHYAERLQAAKGASAYVFVEYTEGLDSSTPFARRVAEGLVRFSDVPAEPGVIPGAAPGLPGRTPG